MPRGPCGLLGKREDVDSARLLALLPALHALCLIGVDLGPAALNHCLDVLPTFAHHRPKNLSRDEQPGCVLVMGRVPEKRAFTNYRQKDLKRTFPSKPERTLKGL